MMPRNVMSVDRLMNDGKDEMIKKMSRNQYKRMLALPTKMNDRNMKDE